MLSFYVLSEDSDPGARSHGHATWAALLRRMCRLLDGSCQTQSGQIDVVQPEIGARAMMAGNRWREAKLHREGVRFWATLAEALVSRRVVIFHVDGDCAWSRRTSSLNVRQVEEIARLRLRNSLEDRRVPHQQIPEMLSRFIPLHPFRAIEAWLFQNTTVLRRLCQGLGQPELLARIDGWEADRTCLDEIDGKDEPKRQMPFGSKHNGELAEKKFPAQAIFAARGSFHDAVVALGDCPGVREGLRETYASERFQR